MNKYSSRSLWPIIICCQLNTAFSHVSTSSMLIWSHRTESISWTNTHVSVQEDSLLTKERRYTHRLWETAQEHLVFKQMMCFLFLLMASIPTTFIKLNLNLMFVGAENNRKILSHEQDITDDLLHYQNNHIWPVNTQTTAFLTTNFLLCYIYHNI